MNSIAFFTRAALRVVALCVLGMFGTYATEIAESTGFLGDFVNEHHRMEWGARHIWWTVMMIMLSILAIARTAYDIVHDGVKAFNWK